MLVVVAVVVGGDYCKNEEILQAFVFLAGVSRSIAGGSGKEEVWK